MKKFISLILIFTMLVAFAACGGAADKEQSDVSQTQGISIDEHPMVKITMEDGRAFKIELYPEYAPETVANFLKLVNEGFYNGLTFHRVIDGFMAQGGSPDGTSNGGTAKIKGEFARNGFTRNILEHKRGTVSMARSTSYDSASSQFFICYSRQEHLDGSYAAFGFVVEGMEVVDDFLKIDRTYDLNGSLSSPVTPIVMKKAEQISSKSAL